MTTEQEIIVWREALYEALLCAPWEVRGEVLKQIADKHAASMAGAGQMKAWTLEEMHAETARETDEWNAGEDAELPPPRDLRIFQAQSVIVQVLTRAITNHHSADGAATILFRPHREHRAGSGSGWLPDYLNNLAGVTVDRAKCAALARADQP
jgi:hypothetical protein